VKVPEVKQSIPVSFRLEQAVFSWNMRRISPNSSVGFSPWAVQRVVIWLSNFKDKCDDTKKIVCFNY